MRLSPLFLKFVQLYPEVRLGIGYTDRHVNLIDEGVDLAIRITRQLIDTNIALKLGAVRMHVITSQDYLASRGEPLHPSELMQHDCLTYLSNGNPDVWQFIVNEGTDRISCTGTPAYQ